MTRSVFLLLFLAACGTTGGDGISRSSARTGVTFAPDASGLAVAGRSQRIDFGRSPRGVVQVMDREKGDHRDLGLAGCPTGVVQQLAWDDLVLTFGRERFVGWKTAGARAGQTCA